MKAILSLLVAVLALQNVESGQNLQLPSEIDIPSMKYWIVQTVLNGFTNGLVKQTRLAKDPVDSLATLLPPIDDPLIVEAIDIPINITLDIGSPIQIVGFFNLTTDTEIVGLGQLINELTIGGLPIVIDLNVQLPSLDIVGQHSVEIEVDLGTSEVIHGSGDLNAHVSNVFATAHAVTGVNGIYLKIVSFALDLGFKNLLIDGGDEVYIDDLPIDWVNISDGIQTWFDATWNGEVKCLIDRTLTCALDYVVGRCTAAGLIGGGDCLRLELNEECLLLLDPSDRECVPEVTTSKPDTTTSRSTDTAPTNSPSTDSTDVPVTGSTNAPVTGSTNAPVTGSTNAPVTGSTNAPVTGSTNAPVTGSTDATGTGSSNGPLLILLALTFVVAINKF